VEEHLDDLFEEEPSGTENGDPGEPMIRTPPDKSLLISL
jgi:hypothetical protein